MRKLIFALIIPIIGFSQLDGDCENSILDEVLQSTEVNQYFQLAISLNAAELQFLNDCDADISYTMFVPGNDVPNESASLLLGLGGELMDYISYYIHMESLSSTQLWEMNGSMLEMMDGNESSIDLIPLNPPKTSLIAINESIITTVDICACNGVIHIINDLIWAPGVIKLNENSNRLKFCVDYIECVLKVSKIGKKGLLEIRDINGKIMLSETIEKNTTINTSNYTTGIYIVQFQTPTENLRELLFIN